MRLQFRLKKQKQEARERKIGFSGFALSNLAQIYLKFG